MPEHRVITKVQSILLSAPHGDFVKHLPTGYRPASLVRLECSDGTTGLGESMLGMFAPTVSQAFIEYFAPYVLGEDPLRIPSIVAKLRQQCLWWGWVGASISALSAIDIALWDIKGKINRKPVWQLLVESGSEKIPLYASGGVPGPKDSLKKEMEEYVSEGYRAVKIRIGHGGEDEVEKTAFVRDIIGSEIKLILDAVQSITVPPWTPDKAIAIGKALEPYDPFWLEEPCGSNDAQNYALVRKALTIPIAGGESLTTAEAFDRFFELNSLSVAQPDSTHVGGISECVKVCQRAHEKGVPIALHSWGTAVGMMANYHVGFGIPNCLILEKPALHNPLIDELLIEPFAIHDGFLFQPSAPGLGVELREEILRNYPYTAGTAYQI